MGGLRRLRRLPYSCFADSSGGSTGALSAGFPPQKMAFSIAAAAFIFFRQRGGGFISDVKSLARQGRLSFRGNSPFATATHNAPKNSHR